MENGGALALTLFGISTTLTLGLIVIMLRFYFTLKKDVREDRTEALTALQRDRTEILAALRNDRTEILANIRADRDEILSAMKDDRREILSVFGKMTERVDGIDKDVHNLKHANEQPGNRDTGAARVSGEGETAD